MKKIVMLSFVFVCFLFSAEAQTKSSKKKAATKKTALKKPAKSVKNNTAVIDLTSTSANAAFAPAAVNKLRIADPTIKTLTLRAAGADPGLPMRPIVGMPKTTYGIANGKILLRNTTATTSGTGYGSGAVGTGTSIQGIGTGESVIGVNGKSPYAGVWLWGHRRPVYPATVRDSSRRR